MPKDPRPIEVGDRFEDDDPRNAGRVVQVRIIYTVAHDYEVEVEAHPKNPQMVGRRTLVSEKTLRTRYRRISR